QDHGQGALVISQTQYRWLRTPFAAVNKLLDVMSTDFKNAISQAALRKNIRTNRAGGFRKPDILGITPVEAAGITVELLEVPTKGEALDTIRDDITAKLALLNGTVMPILKAQAEQELSQNLPPVRFVASTFKPGPAELIWPLIPNMSTPRVE